MTDLPYLLGLLCGFLSGVMNALGAILEKGAVNRLTEEQRAAGVMKHLVRSPRWWAGIVCSFGFGTAFVLTAQRLIGPALVPALTASSLIVLALASVRLLDEHLRPLEHLAILAIVAGMVILGWLHLDIPAARVDLFALGLLPRLAAFALTLGALWAFTYLLALRLTGQGRGLLLAVSAGFPFAISNLWILPLLLTIGAVFGGTASLWQAVLFILACLILVGTNVYGVSQMQLAFCFAPASKALSVQNIPMQIAPILIYFFVFQQALAPARFPLVALAVTLLLLGGWGLGRRRSLVSADMG
ncbi:MAG: DMT family transporter [Anaerolineales bacterium]